MRNHTDAGQTCAIPADELLARSSARWARMAIVAERMAALVAGQFAASETEEEELRDTVLVALVEALERYQLRTSQSFADFAAPVLMEQILNYRRAQLNALLQQPDALRQPKRLTAAGKGRLVRN